MTPSLPRPDGLTITKLSNEDGYWTARVTLNGQTVDVDRRYGSWHAFKVNRETRTRHDVMPAVAAALQERVRQAGGS